MHYYLHAIDCPVGDQNFRSEYSNHDFDACTCSAFGANSDHAKPGQWCPECEDVHCQPGKGHEYNDDDLCVHCGADGRM